MGKKTFTGVCTLVLRTLLALFKKRHQRIDDTRLSTYAKFRDLKSDDYAYPLLLPRGALRPQWYLSAETLDQTIAHSAHALKTSRGAQAEEGTDTSPHYSMFSDKDQGFLFIPFRTKNIDHAMNVSKVFGGFAFPIELKFSQNDVFGRGKGNSIALDFSKVSACESPRVEGVPASEINVGLEARFKVNEVKVSSLAPSLFDLNGFVRWTIELGLRKSGFETARIFWAKENDDINAVCHAGFSVIDGSNTAGDHISKVQLVELSDKNQKGFKRRHAGRFL